MISIKTTKPKTIDLISFIKWLIKSKKGVLKKYEFISMKIYCFKVVIAKNISIQYDESWSFMHTYFMFINIVIVCCSLTVILILKNLYK